MTTYLVDLASYQHGINLSKVKAAGFTRVNIKLSEGTDATVNPDAGSWISQAKSLGLGICTFHWLNGSHSGKDQAAVALAQMKRFGALTGTAHQADCEDTTHPATWVIWRDYVNAMQDGLQRHIINYTGDWWWPAHMGSNNAAALTPYLWAAPNAGYRGSYPGDTSNDWHAGYGGWSTYSALQYAVSPITGAGGGNLSKTAWRDAAVWSALIGDDMADSFTADDRNKVINTYDGMFLGGTSCGRKVQPTGQTAPSNSVIAKLDYLLDKSDAPAAPTPVQVDASAVAGALAGNQDFLKALAKAVNDDAAARLSG